MRSSKTLLLCIFCAALLAQALSATAYEGVYFSISGRVTDGNWNPIQGAVVSLYDNDFTLVMNQSTTESGYFAFENLNVKTNLCTVRVSYTDEEGGEHSLPGYYIKSYPASGEQHIDPNDTHYDFYYLPGSQPHVTPTPEPTLAPTDTPVPVAASQGAQALIFAGGFAIGAASAALACLIAFRHLGKI